jgi:ADP-ribose pyrophosphatase
VTGLVDEPEEWPVHDVEDIWSGKSPFSVRRDVISLPARPDETFGRVVLEHPGAVIVLAVDAEQRALVLRQYRHPASMRFVELPAGLLDQPGEDPEPAARRELQEEGLLVAEHWTHLVSAYPSPGFSSERMEIYLATGLSAAPHRGEDFALEHEEADMTTAWVPVAELLEGFLSGRLTDGPLGLAVMAYSLRGRAGEHAV